jgi:GNAT superfamily N-acetyltransferase
MADPLDTNPAMHTAESKRPPVRINHTPGIVTLTDANTTIGYCRYDDSGAIEYVFVNTAHRRKGYARLLLGLVEARLAVPVSFQPPISPLGERLINFYQRQREADASTGASAAAASVAEAIALDAAGQEE